MLRRRGVAAAVLAFFCCASGHVRGAETKAPASDLQLVVVVTRHGVRSPTDPTELAPYVAYPLAAWEVPPGDLTPRGATLMENFGAAYRARYAALLPGTGCPKPEYVYVWADVDQRTKATAAALLAGLAPRCGLIAHDNGTATDPLFHPLPALGRADPVAATASVASAIGNDPFAIVRAHQLAFTKLDDILGCAQAACRRISSVPVSANVSAKTGLASTAGAVDLASTAVEDFLLAYADGKPLADIGNGAVDGRTLLELSQLHVLKYALTTELPYLARAQGSNLLAHVAATLAQGASGTRAARTRAPLGARFVAFVGHDTNLEALAGLLHLHWLLPGYQPNDTPPGGALVLELHRAAAGGMPFVRIFFQAQSLDQMRALSQDAPARVAVYLPGCPDYDCPIAAFERAVDGALDPAFVGDW